MARPYDAHAGTHAGQYFASQAQHFPVKDLQADWIENVLQNAPEDIREIQGR